MPATITIHPQSGPAAVAGNTRITWSREENAIHFTATRGELQCHHKTALDEDTKHTTLELLAVAMLRSLEGVDDAVFKTNCMAYSHANNEHLNGFLNL